MSRRGLPCRASGRHGLTLVEVLVVMGVSAILLALLVPGVASSRRSASRLKCMRQLNGHMAALAAYAALSKDAWPFPLDKDRSAPHFPNAGSPAIGQDWYGAVAGLWHLPVLDAYSELPFHESLICPNDTELRDLLAAMQAARPGSQPRGTLRYQLSLAMYLDPAALDPQRPALEPRHYRGTRQSDVVHPARKAALYETSPLHEERARRDGYVRVPPYRLVRAGADGAVQWQDASEFTPGVLIPGRVRPGMEEVFRELGKLQYTPFGVRGRDW